MPQTRAVLGRPPRPGPLATSNGSRTGNRLSAGSRPAPATITDDHTSSSAGLAAAHARDRHAGRPSALTGIKRQVAQEMYGSKQYTLAAIAKTLGVSRASIYRHLTHAGG